MTRTNARNCIVALLLALATAPASARAAAPDEVGAWGPLIDFRTSATHSVLMRDGRVLYWRNGDEAFVWDPPTGQRTAVPAPFPIPGINLHCAAQVVLADGRVMAIGGQVDGPHTAIPAAAVFDPVTDRWARVADMHVPRWYPTATVLSDGRVLVTGGEGPNGEKVTVVEVYDPAADTWTVLKGNSQTRGLYAHTYLLPDGRIFETGPFPATWTLDLGSEQWSPGPTSGWRTIGYSESGVMYRPGRIMRVGGTTAALASTNGAIDGAAVIDMTQPSPRWEETATMAFPRRRLNMVILADGMLMAVGGTRQGDDPAQAVLEGEIWDPDSRRWTTVASMSTSRMYHSSALLLPDGRVLAAGGEPSTAGSASARTAQLYSPPYLYKGNRPAISAAPAGVDYGTSFAIATSDATSIQSVALIRPGAVTHANNMDQRYVPLAFTAASGRLTATSPPSGNWAPPGWYMLVIKNTAGVPSVARWIKIGPGLVAGPVPEPPTPPAPVEPAEVVGADLPSQPNRAASRSSAPPARVRAIAMRGRVRLREVRRHGVRATVSLQHRSGSGSTALRATLYRVLPGRPRRAVGTVYRSPKASGIYRLVVVRPSARRSLRPGRYVLAIHLGRNRSTLRIAATRTLTIVP